jgi:hypothetical protein
MLKLKQNKFKKVLAKLNLYVIIFFEYAGPHYLYRILTILFFYIKHSYY